jgi:hypothetical protein
VHTGSRALDLQSANIVIEDFLARVIREFVEHYHGERNHQGLDNRLITGTPRTDAARRVRRRPRLGGLLNYYERSG